jgi:hypothetical protein
VGVEGDGVGWGIWDGRIFGRVSRDHARARGAGTIAAAARIRKRSGRLSSASASGGRWGSWAVRAGAAQYVWWWDGWNVVALRGGGLRRRATRGWAFGIVGVRLGSAVDARRGGTCGSKRMTRSPSPRTRPTLLVFIWNPSMMILLSFLATNFRSVRCLHGRECPRTRRLTQLQCSTSTPSSIRK